VKQDRFRFSRSAWTVVAALWAVGILASCVLALKVGPFDDWSRDQGIGLFQSAIALAGFGAGGVALFLAASQLSSLGSPEVEIRTAKPIILTDRDGVFITNGVLLSAVNVGDAVALAWHCEFSVPEPLSLTNVGFAQDLGPQLSDDFRTLVLNTTVRPLFPRAPVSLGSFQVRGVHAIRDRREFKPRIECRVITERGATNTVIPILIHVSATAAISISAERGS
jgi:hypothetical protein